MKDNLNHSVYLLTERNEHYRRLLGEKRPDLTLTEDKMTATILLADPPLAARHLHDFPELQWLQATFAGVDSLMHADLRKDYLLTNVKGIFGQLISEYVLGYLISYVRHFSQYGLQQEQCLWQPHLYQSIAGKTMVILGTGKIGSFLAESAQALGLHVIGVNRSGIPPKSKSFSQTFHTCELGAALEKADVLVSTLPHTPETENLLNIESLKCCHQTLLFNVGRGKTLQEEDLLVAIERGHIQHAFLDVFQQEPLEEGHPFWRHPHITVTPHIAALSFPEQVVDIFIQNLDLWMHHEPLEHQIDFERGY